MQFNYQSHSLKPGIYKITNTHTGRIYIGQAKRFKERWYDHSRKLIAGNHSNRFLQNDYNKCKEEFGNDDFLIFEVIEVMEGSTKQERNDKEETIIATFFDKCKTCYNIKEKVESNPRSCYSKTPEETKKKISENSKAYWTRPGFKERHIESMKEFYLNPENLDKHSEMLKARWSDDSYKVKVVDKLKETWANKSEEERRQQTEKAQIAIKEKREKEKTLQGIVISPEGIEYEVYHVRTFLKEHGIENNRRQFRMVLQGTRNICKGWTLKK